MHIHHVYYLIDTRRQLSLAHLWWQVVALMLRSASIWFTSMEPEPIVGVFDRYGMDGMNHCLGIVFPLTASATVYFWVVYRVYIFSIDHVHMWQGDGYTRAFECRRFAAKTLLRSPHGLQLARTRLVYRRPIIIAVGTRALIGADSKRTHPWNFRWSWIAWSFGQNQLLNARSRAI